MKKRLSITFCQKKKCLLKIHDEIRQLRLHCDWGSLIKDRWLYIEWYRITARKNEWQRFVKRMRTSGTTSDNEWQRVTTSDNK